MRGEYREREREKDRRRQTAACGQAGRLSWTGLAWSGPHLPLTLLFGWLGSLWEEEEEEAAAGGAAAGADSLWR